MSQCIHIYIYKQIDMETISENCVQIYSRSKEHPFWLHTYISDSEVERTIFKTVGECPTKCTNTSRKTKIQINSLDCRNYYK